MRKRLNWKIILSNIAEAREQLEKIEARVENGKRPSEIELEIMLGHPYHHLNFAWNIRFEKSQSYGNLTDENFNRWSKFPKEIKPYQLSKKRGAA
jgi:hypothetical protein